MIIDEKGLLEGRRLRRCSSRARLLWIYYFAVSNDFGRLEFDFDLIADELRNLKEFSPTPEEVEEHLNEYVTQHLLFRYESNGKAWGVWDTRSTELKRYKTTESKRSPNPPDAPYIEWLKEHHGEEWQAFHTGRSDSSAKPFTKQLVKTDETITPDLPNVDAKAMAMGLAVGVGPGVGNGVGIGLGNVTARANADVENHVKTVSDETDNIQIKQDTTALRATAKGQSQTQQHATRLLALFNYLANASGLPGGEVSDFLTLLGEHPEHDIEDILDAMVWAFTTSDGYKGKMNGSAHFRRTFAYLFQTFQKYLAGAGEDRTRRAAQFTNAKFAVEKQLAKSVSLAEEDEYPEFGEIYLKPPGDVDQAYSPEITLDDVS
jgi:hypothetical protein